MPVLFLDDAPDLPTEECLDRHDGLDVTESSSRPDLRLFAPLLAEPTCPFLRRPEVF